MDFTAFILKVLSIDSYREKHVSGLAGLVGQHFESQQEHQKQRKFVL